MAVILSWRLGNCTRRRVESNDSAFVQYLKDASSLLWIFSPFPFVNWGARNHDTTAASGALHSLTGLGIPRLVCGLCNMYVMMLRGQLRQEKGRQSESGLVWVEDLYMNY